MKLSGVLEAGRNKSVTAMTETRLANLALQGGGAHGAFAVARSRTPTVNGLSRWPPDTQFQRGGNITGLSIQQTDLASKRLEMLREVLPSLRTVAIFVDIDSPNSVLEMGEARAAARTLGLAVVTSEVQRAEDVAPAFDALRGRADALYVCAAFVNQPGSN
jgi:hypothetical protein